jgi:hypothetical protein
MNFSADSDNDIVQGIEDTLTSQGQARDASDQAVQAWELAKTQAKGEYRPDQPEYWPHVQQLSYDLLGLKQDADRPIIQPPGQEPTAIKPSRPLDMGTNSGLPTPSAGMQNSTGYPNYGEAVRRVGNKSKVDNDEIFQGLDWVEASKDLIKELKARDIPEEHILFALVNRIGITPETAKKFYDGNFAEELDESILREDNVYNHMTITTRSAYPYESYGMNANRDPFEWQMSSTRYVAKAIIIEGRYSYECRFEVVQSDTARWPHPWKFLKTEHDVNFALKVSLNQLNADSSYMKLTPDSTPLQYSNESNLLRTIKLMFESYNKIWGASSYQLVIFSTQTPSKLKFLMKVAKELEKINGLKISDNISLKLTNSAATDTAQRGMLYLAIKNSRGAKIKEDLVDETTDSSAFSATPFDAKHDFKRDGAEINRLARQNLLDMGMITEDHPAGNEQVLLESIGDIDAEESRMVDQPIEHMSYTVAPTKTATCYKLFRQRDGKLYPLFIGNKVETPVGKWVEAKFIPTPGFDKRPGWHVGILPMANHLKRHSTGWYAEDRVWAEVEVPADVDWQSKADQSPTKDLKNEVPVGGSYRFKRPKNQGGEWWIAGALKVNRVLSWDEVKAILDAAGQEDSKNPPRTKTPNKPKVMP